MTKAASVLLAETRYLLAVSIQAGCKKVNEILNRRRYYSAAAYTHNHRAFQTWLFRCHYPTPEQFPVVHLGPRLPLRSGNPAAPQRVHSKQFRLTCAAVLSRRHQVSISHLHYLAVTLHKPLASIDQYTKFSPAAELGFTTIGFSAFPSDGLDAGLGRDQYINNKTELPELTMQPVVSIQRLTETKRHLQCLRRILYRHR